MNLTATPAAPFKTPPNHLQLPETDGSIVQNFLELPQGTILTQSIFPVLRQRHPDGQFAIGHDCGIYWRLLDPPLLGCKAPDWFYVPNVPPMLEGQYRRSYVLWQEGEAPLLLIEYVSGDGSEERDRTPITGKFWVYERGIRAPYYAIFDVKLASVEVNRLIGGHYEQVPPNERGHFPIHPLNVELGIWQGRFWNFETSWLRWWDSQGNLLPTDTERAEQEQQRAERFAERLRELGENPNGP